MVICHFWISIIKYNDNAKIVTVGVSWPLGPTGKLFWPKRGKELDHPGLHNHIYGDPTYTLDGF
jgi:hypothetical protein